ncbi:MAG TPA: hypothetical protein VMC06_04505 [Opitutaceae bacterium]|nr:hypothetical protein [Opitutaceae bacterium]
MRPIERGASPQAQDFDNYRDAFGPLQGHLGPYCCYCERRIPTQLAVEHIQAKGLPQYADRIGRWDNFLLGCVNCNGTKKDKDVLLHAIFLPDRDNTAAAFDYTPDGKVVPALNLTDGQRQIADDTLALTGLDKNPNEVADENGKAVAVDRVRQRMEAWLTAQTSKDDLHDSPTPELRRQIVKTAQATGFFSIWMKVFENDPITRRLLIHGFVIQGHFFGFSGTASDCFDQDTQLVSPRPANGLTHGSKI